MAGKQIAIIGAGPAGIIALRTLLNPTSSYDITVFEKTSRAGGIWNYDEFGGPMYRNLRTNLPMPVMQFRDFPFQNISSNSFPTHFEVLSYINQYLDRMDGRKYIKFNTTVKEVVPITSDSEKYTRWIVRSINENGDSATEFDYVFVCNGHYEIPHVPDIDGMNDFQGKVMHSKDYCSPEKYAGKKVILLGAHASGQDIAVDLALHAREIVLSHSKGRLPCQLPSNITETASVIAYENGEFVCKDGTRIGDVDVFMFCTGYCYHFPFLDHRCGVSVSEGRCHPVWKHMINVEHPSMFFIGLCQAISPNPQFLVQCELARAIIDERFILPSKKQMLEDISAEYQRKVIAVNQKPRYLHIMANDQWFYNDEIAELAGCSKLPRNLGTMYVSCAEKRRNELLNYRSYMFEVLSDEEFTISQKDHENGDVNLY